ncbi:choice-of-anchor J domain-containing protein [Leyella stercorea]
MSKTISLKSYAKTLMALTVIAAPIGETIAQTHKVPAEVITRRLANKKAKQQNPTAAAKKAKDTGVQLYGYVLQSDERDPGLYKFTSNNAASISLVSDNVHCYNAATYVQGTYLSSWFEENDTQVKFPIHFYEYDTDTWQMKIDKPSPELAYSAISMDLTFDPETQQVYGLFSDDDYSGQYKTLGKLVTTYWGENDYTSNSETIGELPESMVAITCNRNGDLYTIGRSGKLYAVNKYSGAAKVLGETGYEPFKLFQSATCDYSTGKIYWAMLDKDYWATRIIEIDPTTGKGTEVCNFIDNDAYDQITGLYIKQDLTLKTVPQTVSNLSVDLTGLTSGTVKFTMPTKDVKDVALSGSLKYTVRLNGVVAKAGTAAAGAAVTTDFTTEISGMTNVSVTAEIAADGTTPAAVSAPVSQSVRLGYDQPKKPTALKASAKGQNVTLTWKAPTAGVNGGFFDADKLTYTVVRVNSNDATDVTTLADGLTENTYTDKIASPDLTTYYYKVAANNGDMQSEFAESANVTIGISVKLPYENSIHSEELFDQLTVIDANNDKSTWTFDSDYEAATYKYNAENAGDDWLISPAVNMKKNAAYKFSFDAINTYPVERVAASVGLAPTAEALTEEIIAPTDITVDPRRHTLTGTYRAKEDGLHYFGIHCVSEANQSTLYVDNMKITEVPATAPEVPANFKVVPGDKGASYANISVQAPTTTITGAALSGNVQLKLFRDGTNITTFTNVAPGAERTFKDEGVESANHKYSVVAVNAAGEEGLEATLTVYVGIDKPGAVRNLKAVEDLNKEGLIHVTWDAPLGLHGGYIDPAGLTYYISIGSSFEDVSLGNNNYYDEQLNIKSKQEYTGYSVYAVNSSGGGREQWQTVTAIAGPALKAPMIESFKNCTMKSGPWITNMTNGEIGDAYCYAATESTVTLAQDNDGGLQTFSATAVGKSVRSESPKVDIKNMKSPVLNFWAYLNGDGDELNISVQKDYGEFVDVRRISTAEGTKGWNRFSIDLTPYKDCKFLRIGFEGKAVKNLDNFVAYDNVAIVEKAAADLMAMSIETEERVKAGSESVVEFSFRNNTNTDVKGTDYDIVLYKNDKEVNRIDGVDIPCDMVKTVIMKDVTSVLDPEESTYHATVNYAKDELPENNASAKNEVKILLPDYPVPTALKATAAGNYVNLAWTAPDLLNRKPKVTEESFEDYKTFSIDGVGGWTMYDGDKQKTIQITLNTMFGPLKYDHAGEPMAFQVFNAEKAGIPFQTWEAHTGDQMLVSFSCASTDGGATKAQNDDWLISPQLNGEAQTISFFAKAGMGGAAIPEQFEVLYSKTSKAIANFEKLSDTEDVNNVQKWEEYQYRLPAGTKYFAIRCVSNNKFALLIDDIKFVEADSKPEELQLNGYNVYRDGKKVNKSLISGESFTDKSLRESAKYGYVVTAVYDKGESLASNLAEVEVTVGINDINATDMNVNVEYRSIVITGAAGKTIDVYTTDGALVAQRTATDTERISLSRGMYIVKVAGVTYKVLVK